MKSIIPKTTSPLTKFIRTTEGWLVVGANVALIVVPIVTSALPVKTAATLGVILNGATVISRSTLKAVASLSPILGAPATPDLAGTDFAPSTAELEQGPSPDELGGETVDTSVLDEPGTPADQVKSAGAANEWQNIGEHPSQAGPVPTSSTASQGGATA